MTQISGPKSAKRGDDRMADGKDRQTPRKEEPAQPKAKSGAAEDRQARLAAALRENLRRRKKSKPGGKPA